MGLAPAAEVTRYLESMLFGIAALASYIPARRATQVDPMATLRSD